MNTDKTFLMLSGIPRSGSQVLASMLNQHPRIHASTTSPVIDTIQVLQENWANLSSAQINKPGDQEDLLIRGVLNGAYSHIDKPVIVDKNRLWPRHGEMMKRVLGERPKIICTVRPVAEVLASYVRLIQANSHKVTFIDADLLAQGLEVNNHNRCHLLWEKYLQGPYHGMMAGFNDANVDMLVIRYYDIVNNSQRVMDVVSGFIGIESCQVNTQELQPMPENDDYHGGLDGLHEVRPLMMRTSLNPENVIGIDLYNTFATRRLDFWNRSQPLARVSTIESEFAPVLSKWPVSVTEDDDLPGDSLDYDVLERAATEATFVKGMFCEIGIRRGGSLKYLIDVIDKNPKVPEPRALIAIDPYGNIDYQATDTFKGKLDYTNNMKNEAIPNIYRYAQSKNVNLVFFNMEDTEFFVRFRDCVPVYAERKYLLQDYALVFFDGPHDVSSIAREIEFFAQRTPIGGVWVFDDVQSYDHGHIHNIVYYKGFDLMEVGSEKRKISYRKTRIV